MCTWKVNWQLLQLLKVLKDFNKPAGRLLNESSSMPLAFVKSTRFLLRLFVTLALLFILEMDVGRSSVAEMRALLFAMLTFSFSLCLTVSILRIFDVPVEDESRCFAKDADILRFLDEDKCRA